jgi:Protein of unknown function (DUF1826)
MRTRQIQRSRRRDTKSPTLRFIVISIAVIPLCSVLVLGFSVVPHHISPEDRIRGCQQATHLARTSFPTFNGATALVDEDIIECDSLLVTATSQPSVLRCRRARVQPDDWKRLVPKPWENSRGTDVSVKWTSDESCSSVVERMLQHTVSRHNTKMQTDLAASMHVFQDFCQDHFSECELSHYSARLVASRGMAGTKCPQWHVDHVPCRWIQSLAGPGCQWIANDDAIQWDKINALNDEDNDAMIDDQDRNSLLVDADRAVVGQATEGVAVILLGNQWKNRSVHPAVHKSPDGFLPWQGRVLLTMDVHLQRQKD